MTVLVVADAGLPLDEPIQLTTEDRIVGKGAPPAWCWVRP